MVAINFQKINIELQTFICGLHFCGHAEEFGKVPSLFYLKINFFELLALN